MIYAIKTIIMVSSVILYIFILLKFALRKASQIHDNWDESCSIVFLFSMGQIGEKQIARWKNTGVKRRDLAQKIIRLQLFVLVLVPVGFIVIYLIFYMSSVRM